jgi:hypothetical protein
MFNKLDLAQAWTVTFSVLASGVVGTCGLIGENAANATFSPYSKKRHQTASSLFFQTLQASATAFALTSVCSLFLRPKTAAYLACGAVVFALVPVVDAIAEKRRSNPLIPYTSVANRIVMFTSKALNSSALIYVLYKTYDAGVWSRLINRSQ